MESEHIYVNGGEKDAEDVAALATDYARSQGLDDKEGQWLMILSEELVGLLRGITNDDYTAMFWLEGNKRVSRLNLSASITMTTERRKELIASAKSGKNEAARGIIGRIRDVIAVGFLRMNDPTWSDTTEMFYDGVGMEMLMSGAGPSLAWSLSGYRNALQQQIIDLDQTAAFEDNEPWDELERSIIAHLADDVRVSVRGDDVEIVVERTVGKQTATNQGKSR